MLGFQKKQRHEYLIGQDIFTFAHAYIDLDTDTDINIENVVDEGQNWLQSANPILKSEAKFEYSKDDFDELLDKIASVPINLSEIKLLRERSRQAEVLEDEIKEMYKLDLSENTRLERVRDLFVVGCRTGLRHSDLVKIRKEDVSKDGIKFKVEKTEATLNTVIIEETQEILEKYNYVLPKISRTNLNKYIKEIGELSGIDDFTYKDTYKGGKPISIKMKKYERISSHTARRSFATNMHKRGYPNYYIMKITDHKKESDFLNYIKVTNEEAVKIITLDYKKKAS